MLNKASQQICTCKQAWKCASVEAKVEAETGASFISASIAGHSILLPFFQGSFGFCAFLPSSPVNDELPFGMNCRRRSPQWQSLETYGGEALANRGALFCWSGKSGRRVLQKILKCNHILAWNWWFTNYNHIPLKNLVFKSIIEANICLYLKYYNIVA